MRKAVMIVLALLAIRLLPKALRREARMLELAALLFQVTTAAATNTSKAYAAEARTASLETRVGTLEQGKFANLQSSSVVGQMQAGNFTTITTTGNISCGASMGCNGDLHVGSAVLSNTQLSFLAALSKCGPQPDAGAQDGNSGSTWASGERGYINNAIVSINAIRGALINHGFMAA